MADEKTIIWEPDGTEGKTAAGSVRRYRKPLLSFRWKDLKALFSEALNDWFRHKAPRLGASLAFYTMLSLAPLLIVVIAVAGFLFGREAAQGQIFWQIQDLVGKDSALMIQNMIQGARKPVTGAIASGLGFVTLFLGATAVVGELRDALNTIWEVPVKQASGFKSLLLVLRDRFFSFAMVLGIGFLLLVSLVLSAWLAAAGTFVAGYVRVPGALTQITGSLSSFIVITILFALIYKVMPDIHIEWRDVLLGAAFTSLLFTLGKLAIGMYLGKSNLASTYGAAGSLVLVLSWVYYSAQIFFFGAEFTQVFANRYGSRPLERHQRRIVDRTGVPAKAQTTPEEPRIVTPASR